MVGSPDDTPVNAADDDDRARRAAWLRVLARAEPAELEHHAAPVLADHRFETLRTPEPALIMVRARIGNTGDRFNLGEATVTRCAVRHRAADGRTVAGIGHVLGLDLHRAEQVAQLDALLQLPELHPLVMRSVVHPLAALDEARGRAERERTESSRVHFHTLQPEAA